MQDSNLQPRDYESPALTIVLTAQRKRYAYQHNDVGDQLASHHRKYILPQHIQRVRVILHQHTADFRAFALHTKARLSDDESHSEKCVSGV